MKYWKVFLNFRRSRMSKTVTFWYWWQLFNSFCFEILSFFFVSLFSFCYAKEWEDHDPLGPRCCRPCSIFMNFNRSRNCAPQKLLLNLPDKIDLKRSDKYIFALFFPLPTRITPSQPLTTALPTLSLYYP